MARVGLYKGRKCQRPGCTKSIYKGSYCSYCLKQRIEKRYGLSFKGGYAVPSQTFWRAWRANRDAVKQERLKVERDGNGKYWVKRIESNAKW